MRRLLISAVLVLALIATPAAAQATDTSASVVESPMAVAAVVELFQLALLGLVLLLVGARLRVLTLRRQQQPETWPDHACREASVSAETPSPSDWPAAPRREEWVLRDPEEPLQTGLLPSTASGRRLAHLREPERA